MNRISEILTSARTIAVVGLSGKRYRPSYGVTAYMQRAGYRIIAVNPHETELLGEKCYPDLDSVPESIDIVDIFRRSEFVPEIVEAINTAIFASVIISGWSYASSVIKIDMVNPIPPKKPTPNTCFHFRSCGSEQIPNAERYRRYRCPPVPHRDPDNTSHPVIRFRMDSPE